MVISVTASSFDAYDYGRDNKYTIVYHYTPGQKKLLRVFKAVAREKRYARAGLRFRATPVHGGQQDAITILRKGTLYKQARLASPFTRDSLTDFIEQWIGDYLDALLSARKEAKRASTAVAYASYPPYYGYPYYGAYGWGYPAGYGYGFGYGMGIWF